MKAKLVTLRFVLKKTHHLTPTYIPLHLLSAIIQTMLVFIIIYLPSIAIDTLTQSRDQSTAMLKILVILTVMFALNVTASALRKTLGILTRNLIMLIHSEISENILDIPYEKVEKAGFTDLISNAISPIENLKAISTLFESLPRLVQYVITIIGVLGVIAQFNIGFVVLIIALSTLQFFINRFGIQKETEEAKRSFKGNKHYWYYLRVFRDPVLAKDVRIYHMQPFMLQKQRDVFDEFVSSGIALYRLRDVRDLIGKLFSNALLVIMYLRLLHFSIETGLSPSHLILIVNASTSLFLTLNMMQTELLTLNQQLIYLESYHHLYQEIELDQPSGTRSLNEPIHTIEFEHVSFRYPDTTQDVLKSLNITIHAPTTLSIVGRNGCGKTTMMKLLSRLYKPTEGVIKVNGINIQDYELSSYLNQLAIIFQDFKIFQTTLEDNITFGEVNPRQFKTAVHQPSLDKEFHKFPDAENTFIGKDFHEKGIQLSKGQEQKIAIARSIFKNGSLMILDEPTASLDPVAEEDVYNHFKSITHGKLSIMISHRLSSCKNSDTILFLEDGCVKELGSHYELMAQNGQYAHMFSLQAIHYTDH